MAFPVGWRSCSSCGSATPRRTWRSGPGCSKVPASRTGATLADALNDRGEAYRRDGRYAKAEARYASVLAIVTERSEVLNAEISNRHPGGRDAPVNETQAVGAAARVAAEAFAAELRSTSI